MDYQWLLVGFWEVQELHCRMCGKVTTLAFSLGGYTGTPLPAEAAQAFVTAKAEQEAARGRPGGMARFGAKYQRGHGGRRKKVEAEDV